MAGVVMKLSEVPLCKEWLKRQRWILEDAGILRRSSKVCRCGNRRLVELSTYREKLCTDCHATIPWPLGYDQADPHAPTASDRVDPEKDHG